MIYDVVNTIVYVILANLFFSIFLYDRLRDIRVKVLISIAWISSGVILTALFTTSMGFRVAIALLSNILFAVLIYKGNILRYLSIAILFYVLVMSSDLLVISVWKIFDPDLIIETLMEKSISIYMGTISQLVQMLIVFVLRRFFGNHKAIDVNSKMWIVYLIFPVYSLSAIVLDGYIFDGPLNEFQKNTFTFMAISLLLLNLFVYWFIRQEMDRHLRAQKDMLEVSYAKEELKLYEQMANERNILGKREHEFKNVMSVALKLARDGHINDAISILEKQNADFNSQSNVVETGNPIISAIINSKYAQARDYNIPVRINIGDLSVVTLNERDSIVIISNILNNAIEAAQECEEGKRYIQIKAIVENGQFIFSVHNSCLGGSEGLKSQKQDVISHGYGLDNIRDAVERNKGNCFFEMSEGKFVSVVIIML